MLTPKDLAQLLGTPEERLAAYGFHGLNKAETKPEPKPESPKWKPSVMLAAMTPEEKAEFFRRMEEAEAEIWPGQPDMP